MTTLHVINVNTGEVIEEVELQTEVKGTADTADGYWQPLLYFPAVDALVAAVKL